MTIDIYMNQLDEEVMIETVKLQRANAIKSMFVSMLSESV